MRHQRPQRGEANGPLRRVAGAQMGGGPAVVAFLRLHRAQHRQTVRLPGQSRQMLADAQPRRGGGDLAERPAVGVTGFQVKRVRLTRTAAHPQAGCTNACGRIRRRGPGERAEPSRRRGTRTPAVDRFNQSRRESGVVDMGISSSIRCRVGRVFETHQWVIVAWWVSKTRPTLQPQLNDSYKTQRCGGSRRLDPPYDLALLVGLEDSTHPTTSDSCETRRC